MTRFAAFTWMLVIVGATFLLYTVKYEVQSLHAQIKDVRHELDKEREALNVVSAEWEYLNRPERLQVLASKYLAASSATVEQIAVVEAIPFPEQVEASVKADKGMMAQPVRFQAETGGQR